MFLNKSTYLGLIITNVMKNNKYTEDKFKLERH